MRRTTLKRLRRQCWRLLQRKDTKIRIKKLKGAAVAEGVYLPKPTPHSIHIVLDHYQVDIVSAVIHELLHTLLDPVLETHYTYDVSERFIASLEKPFLDGLSREATKRWRKAIEKKLRG